ncbi:hypothetical protein AJ79_01127 [Helicocarpus griseus UAMH5409]|uniref:Uncharacterized protein n=1 Tax=Helicocarpus griseus UAMH5409 TaxID=1447875 RepID=A0A2B7YAA4_9EURO|nr:hypothetical protein AJ79_01127 [Helicocarpus griseus UAMH5409]
MPPEISRKYGEVHQSHQISDHQVYQAPERGRFGRRLSDDYSIYHLSVGDYLRQLDRDQGPNIDQDIRDRLQQGELLPTKTILALLGQKIQTEMDSGHSHFLIDIGRPKLCIVLHCPEDAAKERFLGRPIPDRSDRKAEMFEKRFDEFAKKQPAILDHYRTSIMELEGLALASYRLQWCLVE